MDSHAFVGVEHSLISFLQRTAGTPTYLWFLFQECHLSHMSRFNAKTTVVMLLMTLILVAKLLIRCSV